MSDLRLPAPTRISVFEPQPEPSVMPAPKMKARAKAPPVTYGTSCAGFVSMVNAPLGSLAFRRVQALLGARRGAALRVLRDDVLEGLLRALAVAHRFLRARDAEHRVGRLLAVGPGGEQLSLRGDRRLVVALAGVRHADPVLRVRRELARGIRHQDALHRGNGERVVAEL